MGQGAPSASDRRSLLLSGHQPVYLPGMILFNKIALSDVFMFVGHCQYVRKSWHARNRIRLGDRELWLTIPVKTSGRFDQSINETSMVNEVWKRKHLGSIRQAYQRAPFFRDYYPELEEKLLAHNGSLGDLNVATIRMILRWLGIGTRVVDSRDYDIRGAKTDMLISMCQAVGADRYLSNEGSRDYVDEEQMAGAGVQHCWQMFEHPTYPQPGMFMPNLSVIDLLFNLGASATQLVVSCGRVAPGKFTPVTERA
ncbi:MAG TPA: WbqC family protein [Candidatus Dormibacteraeota bacterium]|nr:WbqC family protein [Candidatus Dormibacteraeota bacterium]